VGYFSLRDLDAEWGFEESLSVRDVDDNKIVNPVMFDEDDGHHDLLSADVLEANIDNIGSPIIILCACLLGGTQMPVMLMEHGAVGVTASPRTVYFQPAGMLSVLVAEALANGNTTGRALSIGLSTVSADYSNPEAPEEPIDYANQQILFGDPDIRLYTQAAFPHISAINPYNATFGGHVPGRGLHRIVAIGDTNYLPETLSALNIEFDFYDSVNYSGLLDFIGLREIILIEPGLSPDMTTILADNSNALKDYVHNGGTLVVFGATGDLSWVPLDISFTNGGNGSSITLEDSTHPLVSHPSTLSSNIAYEGYFEGVSSNFSVVATDGSNPVIVATVLGSGKLALTTTHPTGSERNNSISNALAWRSMPSLILKDLRLSQYIIWEGDRVTIFLEITNLVRTAVSGITLEVLLNDTDVTSLVQENEPGVFSILLDEEWTTGGYGVYDIHLRATKPGYDTLTLTLISFMYIRGSPWLTLGIVGGVIGLLLASWVYVKYRRGDAILPRRKLKSYSPSYEPTKKESKQRREREKKKKEKEDEEFDAGEFFGV
jgi:hypothetical protein